MENYIQRRQNIVAQYILTRPIMDLCEAAERKCGVRVGVHWWEQVVIDLEGSRDTTSTAEEVDESVLEE